MEIKRLFEQDGIRVRGKVGSDVILLVITNSIT